MLRSEPEKLSGFLHVLQICLMYCHLWRMWKIPLSSAFRSLLNINIQDAASVVCFHFKSWGCQLLFCINMNGASVFYQVWSAGEPDIHPHETLFSPPQDGGPVKWVVVAGGVLASSWLQLEGHWDGGGGGPLSSTQRSHLHLATGLRLHSLQICLWEVRYTYASITAGPWNHRCRSTFSSLPLTLTTNTVFDSLEQ